MLQLSPGYVQTMTFITSPSLNTARAQNLIQYSDPRGSGDEAYCNKHLQHLVNYTANQTTDFMYCPHRTPLFPWNRTTSTLFKMTRGPFRFVHNLL